MEYALDTVKNLSITSSIGRRMNSEDSMKDLLIIKATTTEILFALEALHVKLPKTS